MPELEGPELRVDEFERSGETAYSRAREETFQQHDHKLKEQEVEVSHYVSTVDCVAGSFQLVHMYSWLSKHIKRSHTLFVIIIYVGILLWATNRVKVIILLSQKIALKIQDF